MRLSHPGSLSVTASFDVSALRRGLTVPSASKRVQRRAARWSALRGGAIGFLCTSITFFPFGELFAPAGVSVVVAPGVVTEAAVMPEQPEPSEPATRAALLVPTILGSSPEALPPTPDAGGVRMQQRRRGVRRTLT